MLYVIRQWEKGNVTGVIHHLQARQVEFQFIEAWQSPQYPDLAPGDAVIALGGPPSVCRLWEPDYETPFMIYEAGFLGLAMALELPFLGICLGHQLRARMDMNAVESDQLVFGVQPIDLTPEGRRHWLFEGMPERFWVYQHHRDHVKSAADGATILANSPTCPVEAVAWDERSVSVQFHPEVLQEQFPDALGKYSAQLAASGLTMEEMLARLPADYTRYVNCFFDNFLMQAGVISSRMAEMEPIGAAPHLHGGIGE
ncbi:MAG: type 1 glutamine amidotransferase [Candidatus Xenobia bacterium]